LKIAVIGAGVAGHGIVQAASQNGKFNVTLCARTSAQKGLDHIKENLQLSVKKGHILQVDMDEVLSRIQITSSLKEAIAEADFIIESIPERFDAKFSLFRQMSPLVETKTIIVTNTSTLSINNLAQALEHPERFCGMHFFSPTHVMKLVEITKGIQTSDETIKFVCEVAQKMGKENVVLEREVPGFIVNRIVMSALNEAVELFSKGVASKETIDKAVKLGLNWPMGPLKLIDFVGVDTVLAILEILAEQDPKFEPNPELRRMVSSYLLGRKSGKGFYDWASRS